MNRLYITIIIVLILLTLIVYFIINIPVIQTRLMFPEITKNKSITPNSLGYIEELNGSSVAIIYFHGNAGTACHSQTRLQSLECDKYFIEYPSYSEIANTQMTSEDNFWKSMTEIYLDIYDRFVNKKIIMYGRSIGTGVVAGLLRLLPKEKYPHSIILETPIISISYLIRYHIPYSQFIMPFIIWDKMDNSSVLEFEGPVLIMGGTDDKITPSRYYNDYYSKIKKHQIYIEKDAGHSLTLDYIYPKIKDLIEI